MSSMAAKVGAAIIINYPHSILTDPDPYVTNSFDYC